jgi:hypothetical protein
VHTKDGKTHKIDLSDEKQAKNLLSNLKEQKYQANITGVTVIRDCYGRVRCPKCKKAGFLSCSACGHEVPNNSNVKIGVQYSLSKPDGFTPVFYAIENIEPDEDSKIRGGEKVICFSGATRVTMMVHNSQPSVRVTLLKIGKQRYNPYTK